MKWLREHAIPLRSRTTKDDDFSDLEPLREVVGDAQVLALGEQSHGDGKSFRTKVRLVKFLHQRMGFSVLAWESGIWACESSRQAFLRGEPPIDAASKGIFGIWSGSAQVQPLLTYIATTQKSGRPLEVAGFDSQTTTGWGVSPHYLKTQARLLRDLRSFLSTAGVPLDSELVRDALGPIRRAAAPVKFPRKVNPQDIGAIQELTTLIGKPRNREADFWRQVLRNIVQEIRKSQAWEASQIKGAGDWKGRFKIRDRQMARNLAWLANHRYRDRKIIVWAATAHIMRNPCVIDTQIEDFSYTDLVTMGHVAHQLLGERYRTMGFISHHGRAGRNGTTSAVKPSTNGSLEDLLMRAGFNDAALNFREIPRGGSWLRQQLISRPLGHAEMQADWTKVLDAVVFNSVMTPSTRGDLPSGAVIPPVKSG